MTDAEKREKVVEGLKELQSHFLAMAGISSSKQGRASHIESARTIGEAIALLKAQEPRVMTLEEVKILDSDYYYLESMRSPGKELREIVGTYGLTCVTWPGITWARQTMGDSGYGKTWRCWTARPDEKRRAEIPWER